MGTWTWELFNLYLCYNLSGYFNLIMAVSSLENYVNRTVSIITGDGRVIVGSLKGFDQTINIMLDESRERVYSATSGMEEVILGLYIVRGDNVAVIGEIDDDIDRNIDHGNIRAEPLNSIPHGL